MGAFASTMLASDAPKMYPLVCLDLAASADAANEDVLMPTVLVRESAGDFPGSPRRLTLTARTAPRKGGAR